MVTAKLLNYTFVPRSESSMQIAPPKGDDDVDVVPCLREREGGRDSASPPPCCLHAIIRFQYWTLGKFFPSLSRAQYSTFYCRSVIARCRFYAPAAPAPLSLEPFHKTAPTVHSLRSPSCRNLCTACALCYVFKRVWMWKSRLTLQRSDRATRGADPWVTATSFTKICLAFSTILL